MLTPEAPFTHTHNENVKPRPTRGPVRAARRGQIVRANREDGDYNVFVTFAEDASAAKKSETRLKALAVGVGTEENPDEIVKRRGNVVYYSSGSFPEDAQRQVTECLH